MRLEKTAAFAAKNGFDAFSTSLLISPYQRHDDIRRIGEETAAKYNVNFFYRDFRPLFREGQVHTRSLGLYMQKYCGCIFSEEERYLKSKELSPRRSLAGAKERRETQSGCSKTPEIISGLDGINILTPRSPVPGPRPLLPTNHSPFPNLFQRLALITGAEVLEKLSQTTVFVFGLGGVGSWCAEALVRSGVGKIGIIDFDKVCESNVNRQVQATTRTIGLPKTEVLKQRLLEINPLCEVTAWDTVFSRETAPVFGIEKAGYVIDAIDSLPNKHDLIETSCAAGVKLFSSMGMAKKIDPVRIKTASIWESGGCPLARLVRQGLRKRGFTGNFTVVFSDERLEGDRGSAVQKQSGLPTRSDTEQQPPFPIPHSPLPISRTPIGSVVTVTAAAGLVLASLVLRDCMGLKS